MKTCKRCLDSFPLDAFYKHTKMKDGRLNYCKNCTKKRVQKYRVANLDKIQFYDRQRGRTEKRISLVRQYQSQNSEKVLKAKKDWRRRNKIAVNAHNKVRRAILKGVLKKQLCLVCGEKEVQAHHADYSEPLNVVWLCAKHHYELHRNEREVKRRLT
jgi:ribosomal protein S27AE